MGSRRAHQFEQTAIAHGRDPAAVRRMLSLDAAPVPAIEVFGAFTDGAGRAAERAIDSPVIKPRAVKRAKHPINPLLPQP